MATPNGMPALSAWKREDMALRAKWHREWELDKLAEARGRITESSAYVKARRQVGVK